MDTDKRRRVVKNLTIVTNKRRQSDGKCNKRGRSNAQTDGHGTLVNQSLFYILNLSFRILEQF